MTLPGSSRRWAPAEILGRHGTQYVESLMESVIPEQRWGLGEGGFPSPAGGSA